MVTSAVLVVACDPVERAPESEHHITNPCSSSSKRLYYQALSSLQELVLVSQASSVVELRSAGARVAVDELYARANVRVG